MSGNENPEDSNSPFPHRFNEFDVQDLFGLKLDLMFRHRIQEVFFFKNPAKFFYPIQESSENGIVSRKRSPEIPAEMPELLWPSNLPT